MILDTTFLVDILRGNRDTIPALKKIDESGSGNQVAATTVQEIIRGSHLSRSTKEQEKVASMMSKLTVIPFDERAARIAGFLQADLDMQGEPIDVQDVQIAAVALSNDVAVMTRNAKHFSRIKGLKIQTY